MFWFVLFLILLGGGFYFYQRMITLERQIRAEQALEKERQHSERQVTVPAPESAPTPETTSPSVTASTAPGDHPVEGEQDPVLGAIHLQPGVLQADIYEQLPELNKKQVQQMIRQLVEEGKVRRERAGSSYQLYLI